MRKSNSIMVVVNSSTFRTNQSKYLDMASSGEAILITRNNRPSVVLSSVEDFRMIPTRDITESINQSLKEVKESIEGTKELKSARALLDEL
ncbi:MAG: type II toxin-antitoxin system Phd/YefM family antitoxin [Bacteroides sp.]|nr:type II toxin-antitoxin system Phd/YefM family antitoxin [Bacteroides sp.]MDE7441768.1 type II toxin-antitoxin system Phd/YefM family antitoxin [Muribaculaceae bacterium]